MQFYVHHIEHAALRPYIQYILFNYSRQGTPVKEITSYANTNICLGILKGSEIVEEAGGLKKLVRKQKITSYISGLYTDPHRLVPAEDQDEICIDFTPMGYYHFLPFPSKKYILNEDILLEAFGKDAHARFEKIFAEKDFNARGLATEQFLLQNMRQFDQPFLSESLHYIHTTKGEVGVTALSKKMDCNEKKLYRYYTNYFDVSPQDYKRIVRFRHAIKEIGAGAQSLTRLAYDCEYCDQSHFIREIKKFTTFTPAQCRTRFVNVDDTVLMSIS